jgi:hypothetical protein
MTLFLRFGVGVGVGTVEIFSAVCTVLGSVGFTKENWDRDYFSISAFQVIIVSVW